jgi:hypothetical protein
MVHQNCSAVVFPGQGSQRPGRKDFFITTYFKQTFEEDPRSGLDVAALCFSEGTTALINEFNQPCILQPK